MLLCRSPYGEHELKLSETIKTVQNHISLPTEEVRVETILQIMKTFLENKIAPHTGTRIEISISYVIMPLR